MSTPAAILKHPAPWRIVIPCTIVLIALLVEPALANKFETISGGVNGTAQIKREWLVKFFLVAGGIGALSAVLTVVLPHSNAAFLNFRNWKQSAIVLCVIAASCFGAAAALS